MDLANVSIDGYEGYKTNTLGDKARPIKYAFLDIHQAAGWLNRLKKEDYKTYESYDLQKIHDALLRMDPKSFENMRGCFSDAAEALRKDNTWAAFTGKNDLPESPKAFEKNAINAFLAVLQNIKSTWESKLAEKPLPEDNVRARESMNHVPIHVELAIKKLNEELEKSPPQAAPEQVRA